MTTAKNSGSEPTGLNLITAIILKNSQAYSDPEKFRNGDIATGLNKQFILTPSPELSNFRRNKIIKIKLYLPQYPPDYLRVCNLKKKLKRFH